MWNKLSASESEGVVLFVEFESDSVSLEAESGLDASLVLEDFPCLGGWCWFVGVLKGFVFVGHLVCLVICEGVTKFSWFACVSFGWLFTMLRNTLSEVAGIGFGFNSRLPLTRI